LAKAVGETVFFLHAAAAKRHRAAGIWFRIMSPAWNRCRHL